MLARRGQADQVLGAGFDTESDRIVVAARRPVTVPFDCVAGRERMARSDFVRKPALAAHRVAVFGHCGDSFGIYMYLQAPPTTA